MQTETESQETEAFTTDTYRQMLGIEDVDVEALLQLAQRDFGRGARLAEETLSVLIDLDPFCVRAFKWMALVKRRQGNNSAANTIEDFIQGMTA
ncbi:MAG: hypothetical protein R3A47_02535 [Polyangiales bacterium]